MPAARSIVARVALALASGALEARINGDNLPDVIEGILREVAWEDLDLADDAAVAEAAEDVLRAA